jgi:hypothetical protein
MKTLRAYYDRAKSILLVATFFFIVIAYYFPVPEFKPKLLVPFIFASTFIIIEMLVRITLSIEKKPELHDCLANREEALKFVEDKIRELCKKRKRNCPITVKVLGFRGRFISIWLEGFLKGHIGEPWLANIDFEFYLVDADFAHTLGGMTNHRESIVGSTRLMRSLCQESLANKSWCAKGIRIQLFTYQAVNPFHAFLIGDNYLILSYFQPAIESGKLIDWIGPAKTKYYCYSRDKETHQFMFEVIESWLDFYGGSELLIKENAKKHLGSTQL